MLGFLNFKLIFLKFLFLWYLCPYLRPEYLKLWITETPHIWYANEV